MFFSFLFFILVSDLLIGRALVKSILRLEEDYSYLLIQLNYFYPRPKELIMLLLTEVKHQQALPNIIFLLSQLRSQQLVQLFIP
jgi:hypothetical protein